MYLSRFGVKNYKCLGEIDIPLTPIHVLIGENDAGKTSLLEAMAAYCASHEGDLARAFPGPWAGRELVFHASPEPCVKLWAEWSAHEGEELAASNPIVGYGFSADFPSGGTSCSMCDRHVAVAETGGGLLSRITYPFDDRATAAWQELVRGQLKRAPKYALDAKIMAIPAAIDPARKFRLDPDGFGLPTLLADISDYDPAQSIRLREELSTFFKQFRSVRVESEDAMQRHYQASGEHTSSRGVGKGMYFETQNGGKIRAQQASDGAILFLGFLALAHLPDPPNLLLIEEPENGIYPKRLGEVIKLLKELVNRAEGVRFPQIIMSTHSPYVLSFFEPEEVTFLSRPRDDPDGPVRARPLRDAPNIKERMADGFYLGELWYNLSEEDLFGER